jgi:predicted small secreted protein
MMRALTVKFVTRLLVVLGVVVLSACGNTWEGIKKDSSEAGKAIGEATESAGKTIKEAAE